MRIAIYLSIFIVLVIVLISSSVSYVYSKKLISQTSTIAEQNMKIIIKDLDEEINSIFGLCDGIRNHEELQALMGQKNLPLIAADAQKRRVSAILRQSVYAHAAINSIFAFGLEKQVFDPLYQISPYREIIADYAAFDQFILSGKFNALSAPTSFPNILGGDHQEEKSNITYFSQYLSNNNFKMLGYILININKDYLFRNTRQICLQMFDFTYIIDDQGQLIEKIGQPDFSDQLILDFNLHHQTSEMTVINSEDYYLISQPLSAYPDWTLVSGITAGKVKADSRLILKIVYLISFFSILIAILIAYFLSKKVTDPILAINHAMAQFEDRKWPDQLTVKTEDELKSLVQGFNHMVEQFRTLLDQVRQEHEEKEKVEVKTLELKLDLLQAQINPHFVHNTLNAVQYLALKRGAEDIREIIQSFNLLLRASMSVGRDFITVREEIACVESYLKIQSYRYDNAVKVVYQVDEGVKEEQIPKLILQPIVENALYHGIIPKEGPGEILIRIQEDDGQIIIAVEDDGVGMQKEVVDKLFSSPKEHQATGYNNIGLQNITDRLHLYYGEDYYLHISSELGLGTCVWFKIPKSRGQREDQ